VCGKCAHLSTQFESLALNLAHGGSYGPDDVELQPRCGLEEHHEGPHHGLLLDLEGRAAQAVWTRWEQSRKPQAVLVLADCPAQSADGMEACAEFADHPGGHTWELARPSRGERG
jgi:hypothetical protein